eukprot:scaffold72459_cov19-Prasinocladus_malaysianus.AAC.1
MVENVRLDPCEARAPHSQVNNIREVRIAAAAIQLLGQMGKLELTAHMYGAQNGKTEFPRLEAWRLGQLSA